MTHGVISATSCSEGGSEATLAGLHCASALQPPSPPPDGGWACVYLPPVTCQALYWMVGLGMGGRKRDEASEPQGQSQ